MPDLICSQYLASTSTTTIPQIPLTLFSSQSTKAYTDSLSVENMHMTIYCIHFWAEM
jgi:hypothetical protein